ncbi:MAG: ferrochelatase [Rickettsiaceae bacterium]|nr:ferrochelatase [Rickettsiaceae bacterium]
MSDQDKKTAVVLMNLGGPDSLDSVESFLFNLFYDRAIIDLPNPLRWMIAKFISKTRASHSREIYKKIGGFSPIIKETEKQKLALEKVLKKRGSNVEIFIAMRYFHPMSKEVAKEIKSYNPDEIVLLPLYPQFSTATSLSSIMDIKKSLLDVGINKNPKTICCYFDNENFIKAHVELIKKAIDGQNNVRILFSAHGLPKKIIEKGDPYQWQIEQTTEMVMKKITREDLEYKVTYQSKVGPVEWIGPDTEKEIEKAAIEGKTIVICPISFVSEHVETLVELDIEYAEIAKKLNAKYIRVETLGINENFIESLADVVVESTKSRKCPEGFSKCVCAYE